MSTDAYWNRLRKLIDGLIEGKAKGVAGETAKWQQVAQGTYELNLSRSTLRIRSRDGDGQYPYVFDIVGEDGMVQQSVEDDGDPDYVGWRLADLYGVASISHSGADEKLVEIMQELGISTDPDPWGDKGAPF
ncbi:hypothetical protein ACQI4L_27860 [Mycolicibacterium litorale]|uniref:hypothetical protein n=1 Tax=Mycolicibacterium litorale TaxID=758802 RepID=UPI003CF4BB99